MTRDDGLRARPGRIKSIAKAFQILECFSALERSLSLGDVAERAGLPKATAHRLLASLREIGFVEQDRERDRYRLGIKLFQLGSIVMAHLNLNREAGPLVERLSQLSGEIVHLCVFDGLQMVFIDRKQLNTIPRNLVTTIEAAPVHCTGVGKAVLAFQAEATVARVVRLGLRRYTDCTITDPERLRAELAAIRVRGYSIDDREHQPDVRCVGAPIRNVAGAVFASISVSAAAERLPDTRIPTIAEVVVATADAISRRLGHDPRATPARAGDSAAAD